MPRNARQRAGGLLKPKEGLNGPPPNTDRRAAPDNAYALIEGQPLTGTMGDKSTTLVGARLQLKIAIVPRPGSY